MVAQRLYLEVGEPIRFRVDSIEWQDLRPDPPNIPELGSKPDAGDGGEEEVKVKDPYKSAGFRILVSLHPSKNGQCMDTAPANVYIGCYKNNRLIYIRERLRNPVSVLSVGGMVVLKLPKRRWRRILRREAFWYWIG